MDQIDATRVVIECPDKTLVIEQPEVVSMEQMGQQIYQVIGEAEERSPQEVSMTASTVETEEEPLEEEEVKPSITENDVMLVAAQAGVPKEEAQAALEDHEGDIAKAIIFLKNR